MIVARSDAPHYWDLDSLRGRSLVAQCSSVRPPPSSKATQVASEGAGGAGGGDDAARTRRAGRLRLRAAWLGSRWQQAAMLRQKRAQIVSGII